VGADRRASLFLNEAGEALRQLIEDRPPSKVVLIWRSTWQLYLSSNHCHAPPIKAAEQSGKVIVTV
jgi:hypothetical protein